MSSCVRLVYLSAPSCSERFRRRRESFSRRRLLINIRPWFLIGHQPRPVALWLAADDTEPALSPKTPLVVGPTGTATLIRTSQSRFLGYAREPSRDITNIFPLAFYVTCTSNWCKVYTLVTIPGRFLNAQYFYYQFTLQSGTFLSKGIGVLECKIWWQLVCSCTFFFLFYVYMYL